jgi:hypothetical protein
MQIRRREIWDATGTFIILLYIVKMSNWHASSVQVLYSREPLHRFRETLLLFMYNRFASLLPSLLALYVPVVTTCTTWCNIIRTSRFTLHAVYLCRITLFLDFVHRPVF